MKENQTSTVTAVMPVTENKNSCCEERQLFMKNNELNDYYIDIHALQSITPFTVSQNSSDIFTATIGGVSRVIFSYEYMLETIRIELEKIFRIDTELEREMLNKVIGTAVKVLQPFSTHQAQFHDDSRAEIDDITREIYRTSAYLVDGATYYKFASINVNQIIAEFMNIECDGAEELISSIADVFLFNLIDYRKFEGAVNTLPCMIYVAFRNDKSVDFAQAFEEPVSDFSDEPPSRKSEKRFISYAEDYYSRNSKPEYAIGYGKSGLLNDLAERMGFDPIISKVEEYIRENFLKTDSVPSK